MLLLRIIHSSKSHSPTCQPSENTLSYNIQIILWASSPQLIYYVKSYLLPVFLRIPGWVCIYQCVCACVCKCTHTHACACVCEAHVTGEDQSVWEACGLMFFKLPLLMVLLNSCFSSCLLQQQFLLPPLHPHRDPTPLPVLSSALWTLVTCMCYAFAEGPE